MKAYVVIAVLAGLACVPFTQSALAQADETTASVVVSASSETVQPGGRFTLQLSLIEDLTEPFDFYLLADTPYGTYTIFLSGKFKKGIQPLFRNIPGYEAPFAKTIWNNVRVPQKIRGAFTFYAVVVQAGALGEVVSLADLAADNEYVISHDTVETTFGSDSGGPTPTPVATPTPPQYPSGRSGGFYLPDNYTGHTLPLLVAFHGSGGSGEGMVDAFQALAAEYGFIIVAPDSGDPDVWYIHHAGYESDDYPFIMEWVDYIRNFPGVTIDDNYVMTLGFSGGCPVAPYIATNDEQFTHFASLHGEVWEPSIGGNLALAWLSTGTTDWWTPALYTTYKTMLEGKGFTVTRTIYDVGHSLTDEEKRGVISWWLGY
jgi:predicted esterase